MRTVNVANNDFVSRAEGKLAGAVRAFSYDFRNKTVLDIGSSTGGFTELALKLGAKKVIAIEKGTNQMKSPLRFDPRIELHEKTDFFMCCRIDECSSEGHPQLLRGRSEEPRKDGRDERPEEDASSIPKERCYFTSRTDVILADVSFVSLKKILIHAKQFADTHTDFLVMLKPQFEANPEQLWRGVVKNEKIRREIIKDFENWLKNHGFLVIKKHDNDVVGKNGNKERFYFLKLSKNS